MDLKKPCATTKRKKSVKRLSKSDSKGKENFVSNSKNFVSLLSKNNSKQTKQKSMSLTDTSEITSKLPKSNLKDYKKSKTETKSSELLEHNVERSGEHNLSKNVFSKTKKKSLGIQKKSTNLKLSNNKSKKQKEKYTSVNNSQELNSESPKNVLKQSGKISVKETSKKSISPIQLVASVKKLNKQKRLKANHTDGFISISKNSTKNNKSVTNKDSVAVNTKLSKVNSNKNKFRLKKLKEQHRKANNDQAVKQSKQKKANINTTEDLNTRKSSKKVTKKNKSMCNIDSIIQKNVMNTLTEVKNTQNQDNQIKYAPLITIMGEDIDEQLCINKFENGNSIYKKNSVKLTTKISKSSVENKKTLLKKKEHNESKKSSNKEHNNSSRKRKLASNISEDLSSIEPSKKIKAQLKKAQKVETNHEIQSIKSKKRKQSNVNMNEKLLTESSLSKDQIVKYLKGLLTIVEGEEHKKKSLFSSDKPPILLLLNCIKVPKQPLHQMRMLLPHSMISSDDDVALFVKDLKRGRRIDCEETIRHYEDLLRNNGISQIKAVIPINQVKTEYRQYEMRRRLLSNFDYFIAEGKIVGHMAHLLGKTFRLKRKLPTSISFDTNNLQAEFDKALRKTIMQMHSNGDSFTVQVGTCSMDIEKVADNILSIITDLQKDFPGGWENIRCLRLKVPLSMAIPIYMTLKSRNDVKVPVVTPKRPKAYKDVEGELSTFTDNVNVTVTPDGTVKVQKTPDDSDEQNKIKEGDSIEGEMQDESEKNEVKDVLDNESEESS